MNQRERTLFERYVDCRNEMAYAITSRGNSFGIQVDTDYKALWYRREKLLASFIEDAVFGPHQYYYEDAREHVCHMPLLYAKGRIKRKKELAMIRRLLRRHKELTGESI
jgi:hypothetical protein